MTMRGSYWTPEQDDLLKELCARGMSYSEMGKQIGKSKSACVSRAKRKGFAELCPAKPVWNAGLSKDLAAGKLKVEERARKADEIELLFCEGIGDDYEGFQSIPFEGLQHGMCRWPRGDVPDTVFCGDRTLIGSSWCAHHRSIAFIPNRPNRSLRRL